MNETAARTLASLRRLDDWGGLSQIETILTDLKRRSNLFLIAPRLLNVEGIHSDLLAWMLDPKGWHGLGDHFACAFVRFTLEQCGQNSSQAIAIRDVTAEFSTGKGPVDILVRFRLGKVNAVLGIENKIHSPEGHEQLERYSAGLAMKCPGEPVTLAFLTPNGRKPTDVPQCPVASVSYGAVATLLETAVSNVSADQSVGPEIVRHYISALRTHVMPGSNTEIDALCRALLEKHKDAWRVIRRRLPSRRDDFHAAIGASVCEWLKAEQHGNWRFVVRRDRYACVFRDEWFSLGAYSADSLVEFEQGTALAAGYPRVHFRLVADSSDSDADEEYRYALRLKVDKREKPDLGKSLVRVLQSLDSLQSKIPERDQWTVTVKSTSNLPAMGDESTSAPDRVVEWYARHLTPLVPAIDAVFRTGTTARRRR